MTASATIDDAPISTAERLRRATYRKVSWRIVPLLMLCYTVSYLDRVNIGFAKLQMSNDLGFSDAVFGLGAGIFFIGYVLFEVPSNLLLARIGAKVYLAASDGNVWVANQDEGTVTVIDAVTGERRTIVMGHPTASVAVGAGQALVSTWIGKNFEDEIASIDGSVAKILVPGYSYYPLDPAITNYSWNPLQQQLADATCSRLLRYPNEIPSAAAANSLAASDFDFAVTVAAKMNAS